MGIGYKHLILYFGDSFIKVEKVFQQFYTSFHVYESKIKGNKNSFRDSVILPLMEIGTFFKCRSFEIL